MAGRKHRQTRSGEPAPAGGAKEAASITKSIGDFIALAKTIVAHYLCCMSTQPTNSDDLASLYRRAFAQYGTQALWNKRAIADPSREDALVVARALRIEGNLAARKLAEQIERACHAAI